MSSWFVRGRCDRSEILILCFCEISRIAQIPQQSGERNSLHFFRTSTRLACKSKLGKVFVRIKLSIGSKVVWHLHICMAKACLFECFAISVKRGSSAVGHSVIVAERLTSMKVCVSNSWNDFTFFDCHIWPAFHLGSSTASNSKFQQIYGS